MGLTLPLNRFEAFALERMADPLNKDGLWFEKDQVPGSMLRLVRDQLVECIGQDQIDIGFKITQDGLNYYNTIILGKMEVTNGNFKLKPN